MITKIGAELNCFEKTAGKSAEGFKQLIDALHNKKFDEDIVLGSLDKDMYDGLLRTYGRTRFGRFGQNIDESVIGDDIVIPGLGSDVDEGLNHIYLHRIGDENKRILNPYTGRRIYTPEDVAYTLEGIFDPNAMRGLSYSNDKANKFGIQQFLELGNNPNPVIVAPTDKDDILRYVVLNSAPYDGAIGVKTGYILGRNNLHNRLGIAEGKMTAPITKRIPYSRYGLVTDPNLPGGFTSREQRILREQLTDANIRALSAGTTRR